MSEETENTEYTLRQRWLLERREFCLKSDRIRLFSKDSNGEVEVFIPYENLTTSRRMKIEQNGVLFNIMSACAIFAAIGFLLNMLGIPALMRWAPLWAVSALILSVFHFFQRRKYLLLDLNNEKAIYMLHNKPSEKAMQDFLARLDKKRIEYLRDTYMEIEPECDAAEVRNRYRWLRQCDVITDGEVQQMEAFLLMLDQHQD